MKINEYTIEPRADLRLANLYGADLRLANLSGVDLRMANLTNANLTGADLTGACLYGAHLTEANLTEAGLRGANLSEANLTGANLSGASLRGANLSGANLSWAIGIVCLGTDRRGYRFVGVRHDDGWRILAGCRWFTIEQAVAHWADNKEALARVAMLGAI